MLPLLTPLLRPAATPAPCLQLPRVGAPLLAPPAASPEISQPRVVLRPAAGQLRQQRKLITETPPPLPAPAACPRAINPRRVILRRCRAPFRKSSRASL